MTGSGEFAELAAAFNAMADNIRRSEEKLVDLNTALVREIRDRTAAEAGCAAASSATACSSKA